jgi:flagellar basal-body rod modification protein FlgD
MGFISPIPTDASGQAKQTGSMQVLGKDDFLQLLVTKLQYQDPLEPMQDEDFIAQLAQFSSLEQMNNIADGISTANDWSFLQMQSINNTMASGFIGKEVTADFNGIYADGSNEPKISFSLDRFASDVTFTITDADGAVVRTFTEHDLEAGAHQISWDGKDSIGNTVAEGIYNVSLTASEPSGNSFTPSLSLVGLVESIVYRDGAAYLQVNGVEISLGDVVMVGEPGSFEESGDSDDSYRTVSYQGGVISRDEQ